MASNNESHYLMGTYEVQECLEGEAEADLPLYNRKCQKNPVHAGFIPVNELALEHFPAGYRDNSLLNLTKSLAYLTVRIAVKFSSVNRPEFLPGSSAPYPGYGIRGKNCLRTGTGEIFSVIGYTEGMVETTRIYRTCPCPECEHSDTPSKVWWEVGVRTARHVVYDSSEAKQSSCRLWFNEENSPVVNIYGWRLNVSLPDRDWSELYCATHDKELAEKLLKPTATALNLWRRVNKAYFSRRNPKTLVIIVSHPHGCPKKVSVGHVLGREVLRGGQTRYKYTNSTCPGSSGARVYRLGCLGWSNHPHSGCDDKGINFSAVLRD